MKYNLKLYLRYCTDVLNTNLLCFKSDETSEKLHIIKAKLKKYNKVICGMKLLETKGFDISESLSTIESKTKNIHEKLDEINEILETK